METINKIKKGWLTAKNRLGHDIYSLTDTISILKKDDYYLGLMGKSKNRTLMKEDGKLYNSIYHHTQEMDSFNKNNNKFSIRILFLIKDDGDIDKIKCQICHNSFTTFNYEKGYFNEFCLNCFNTQKIKYPTEGWFKLKYGNEWQYFYNIDREKIKNKKVGSRDWYVKKYGETIGVEKYYEITNKRIESIINVTKTRVSKISQELFWLIYSELNDDEKKNCFFHELNNEYLLRDGRLVFFIDFKCGNKIIEYDGIYWHKDELSDSLRNDTYKRNNFDLLVINENDFNRKNKNKKTVDECVKFIRNGN